MTATNPPGALAGRYTIIKKIADGGMAEIFLAMQLGAEGFERPVILKRILPALSADPQFRHMLVDEAHIAMSLSHGNIAQVLDLGEAEGRTFLVLELVDGWDLQALLDRSKRAGHVLPDGLALYITAEICRALAYAHAKSRGGKPLAVIHRDVSPQNVLVSEQGEVKLTDFGIAKALGRREQTRTGVIKGKLAFMSPEQAAGAPLDARSDIFAVGSVLYTMTTGAHPFQAPSDLEALLRVQSADCPPPDAVRADLPPAIARLIDKAMKKLPSERFRNAEEMMLEAEEALRASFGSPGQSELKRWLAELAKRDREPPISRAQALPVEDGAAALAGTTVALDAPAGTTAFEAPGARSAPAAQPAPRPAQESSGSRTEIGLAHTVTFGATPAIGAPASSPPPRVAGPTPPPATPRRGGWAWLALLLLAGGAAAAWKLAPTPSRAVLDQGRRAAGALSTTPAEREDRSTRARAAADEPRAPADSVPADRPVADVAAAPGRAAEGPAPRAGARDGAAPAGEPRAAPAGEPRRERPALVKVRFDSRPRGALVRSKARVNGRPLARKTPFELQLPIGSSLDVTFSKAGYASERRTVIAAGTRTEARASLAPASKRGKARRRR